MTITVTRTGTPLLRLATITALMAVEGCFSLARPTAPLEEYVLGAGAGSASAAAPTAASVRAAGAVSVGVRRLELAPYLATTAIVVRRGSRIETSGFRRWAEEPGAGIVRAVASALAGAPNILAVDVAPWAVRTPHDYLVQLHVSNLEGVAADAALATTGEVRVTTVWEIVRNQDGTLVARGESDFLETGWTVGDYRGLVAGIDRGLTALARDVAACLLRLGPVPLAQGTETLAPPLVCTGR
jgi:uncharacterized lipoprotein YmbA